MSELEQILSTYTTFSANTAPRRVLSTWSEMMRSGQRTIAEFLAHVTTMQEYRDRKTAEFAEIFMSYVGTSPSDADVGAFKSSLGNVQPLARKDVV